MMNHKGLILINHKLFMVKLLVTSCATKTDDFGGCLDEQALVGPKELIGCQRLAGSPIVGSRGADFVQEGN